jgi:DNA ligase (NAD+)
MNLQALQKLPIPELIAYYEREEVETLLALKKQLDDLYYNDTTEFDDFRYDLLRDRLDVLVPPTVGAQIREGEAKVELPFWLGSLNKITTEEALEKWVNANPSDEYLLSYKLDGVSCLLEYDGREIHLYTRGNGLVGSDITHMREYVKLPKLKTPIFVRGELILSKSNFEKYTDEFKNPRNAVSGLLGGKRYKPAMRDIEFIAYEIVEDSSKCDSFVRLKNLGFKVVTNFTVPSLSLDALQNLFLKERTEYAYNIDGIVVQSYRDYDRNTSGNPSYAFAFKMLFETDVHSSVVREVEWNVSKWGRLKPVVIIDPVKMGDGVTISRATAHNGKFVVDNAIRPGTVVVVTRSKDVIPYILEVRNKTPGEPSLPTVEYEWDATEVNLIAVEESNESCVKRVSNFFAQLSIKHVSDATVGKLFAHGFDSLMKIIRASQDDLCAVPGIQARGAERIYTNIHSGLQNITEAKLLSASSVLGYGIGAKRIETLLSAVPNLLKFKGDKLRTAILGVEGFSDILADTVIANVPLANEFLDAIRPFCTFAVVLKRSNELRGLKVVFSGFRDKKLEALIVERGGTVVGSVSKNTRVMVTNDVNSTSSKVEKARELGVVIMSPEEFRTEHV